MNQEHEQEVDTESVKQAARTAAERGESIREEVRDITLKVLSEGRLDAKRINQVVGAVVEGVSLGAEAKGTHVKEALSESIAGIDDALASSAEASKLAVEEAAGHLKEFGKQDLKRALDDLAALEGMFLDTVKNVANGSNQIVKETLNDLVQHGRTSGTAAGERATRIIEKLNREVGRAVSDTVSAGTDAALKVGAQLSQAAAGFLEGIAESLQKKASGHQRDDNK